MNNKRLIIYNIDVEKLAPLARITEKLDTEVVIVSEAELNERAGFLAGLEGYKNSEKAYTGIIPKTECMLICGFKDKELDKLFNELKAKNIQIECKALLTEFNKDWSFGFLVNEVEKDHKAFLAYKELKATVEKAKKTDVSKFSPEKKMKFEAALFSAMKYLKPGANDFTVDDFKKANQELKNSMILFTF